MTVTITPIERKNAKNKMAEVFRDNQSIGILIYNVTTKKFSITCGGNETFSGDSFFDYNTKEQAIAKALQYYGYMKG